MDNKEQVWQVNTCWRHEFVPVLLVLTTNTVVLIDAVKHVEQITESIKYFASSLRLTYMEFNLQTFGWGNGVTSCWCVCVSGTLNSRFLPNFQLKFAPVALVNLE